MTPDTIVFIPKYFTQKAIITFGVVLLVCTLLFFNKLLGFQWIIFDLVAVVGFFGASSILSKSWMRNSTALFQQKLFWTSFVLRIIWVFFSYFYFISVTGQPFEYDAADSGGYYGEAQWVAGLFRDKKIDIYLKYIGKNYADMGYPSYLAAIALIAGDGILPARLLKALWGAITCILIYRIAKNNFGESIGRLAGILSMLLPNLIYYTGLHVKETEMVFITMLFAYLADKILKGDKRIALRDLLLLVLFGGILFLFRTVLAACMIASVGIAIVFISKRVSRVGRRMSLAALGVIGVVLIMSSPLQGSISEYLGKSDENIRRQMLNYTKYADNTNSLAQYGSKSIFLPMMLVAPFPTLIDTNQLNPMMLGGAFFTRNIYAFFVFLALYAIYKKKKWREYIFLLSCLFSYLFVLGSSGFALSERFHLPALPFMMILSAYGISQLTPKNKKYYIPYLFFISVVIVGWNWFKLAGRA